MIKVFLSWSGTTSRGVAEALAEWLPKVFQGVTPFVSAKDIDKGANWTTELSRELETTEFGIICLAPDNLASPWLNYETGAISKSVDSRVCPVLFGVTKDQIKPPMQQLQLTSIDSEEFVLLISSLNKVAGSPLSASAVREAVEVWWPRLEASLEKVPLPAMKSEPDLEPQPEPAQPMPDVTEMLEELLARMRALDARVGKLEPRGAGGSRSVPEALRARLRPAMKHLQDVLEQSGMPDSSVRINLDGLHVRINENVEIPEAVADAAKAVAEVDNVIVLVETIGDVRKWGPRDLSHKLR